MVLADEMRLAAEAPEQPERQRSDDRMAAERVGAQRPGSSSHRALRHALMTPKEKVPAETRRKVDLFTAPYWGSLEEADRG
jgi:hypothetical protein